MNSTSGWQTGYNGSDLSLKSPESSQPKLGWGGSSNKTYSSPLAHPDSWPQLGEATETLQKSGMHQQPGSMQQQDVGGWGGGGPAGDPGGAGTNSWGGAQATGWGGADVGGSNWGRQPQVDNGTAVWGKPSQSSPGWGAPASSAPAATGWGAPVPSAQSPSGVAPDANPQNDTQQTQVSQQQPANTQTQAPESWAAAAAAPPAQQQPSQNAAAPNTERQANGGTEVDDEKTEAPSQQMQTQEQKVAEMQDNVPMNEADDAVQKLVNSHEGWGKRPIQQNTSWNISESPNFARQSSSKMGTEAWGKVPPGQGSAPGWNEPSKPAWQAGSNSEQSAQQWGKPTNGQNQPARGWGAPTQPQQPRLPWGSSQTSAGSQAGWGDPRMPPPMAGMNNNRWPTPPNPMQNSGTQGWGAPQSNNPISGWGNQQPATENSNWAGGMQRNPQGTSNWGAGRPSGPGPDNTWNQQQQQQQQQQNMQRLSSQVDDGTSAWGDPGAYKNVNMWDKKQAMGMGDGNQAKPDATGWGAQGPTQVVPNKPPSPTGWGDANPARAMADNGTSAWGKPGTVNQSSNWDQSSGWGVSKPNNNTGWGGAGEQQGQQWGQGDGWNQGVKNDIGGPKNMEFGGFIDRKTSTGSDSVFEDNQGDGNGQGLNMGMPGNGRAGVNFGQFPGGQPNNPAMVAMNGPRPVPPQPLMNQPSLQAQMMQGRGPPMPPQLQSQLQQIRHAVMKGVIPQQMLNPQLMTPQHLNLLQQLVMKTTEHQQLLARMSLLTKQPSLPPHLREQTARMIQQCQQQIQAHQRALTQNMLQKTNQLQSKTNLGGMGPGGLDLAPPSSGALPPSNSTFNMSSLTQGLPGAGSTANREQQSRLNTWRRPSMGMDGPVDNGGDPSMGGMMSHPSISDMIGVQGNMLPAVGQGLDMGNQNRVTGGGLLGLQQPDGSSSAISQPGDPSSEASDTAKELNGSGGNLTSPDEAGSAEASPTDAEQDANGENLKKILADIGPPEFIPGVKWKGFRPIDPESDPDITPGSVAIAKTMSVNTVKDVDQVLNRDRYTNSQVGSPASNSGDVRPDAQSQSLASSFANTLTDNPAIAPSTWSTATGGGGSSLSHTPTSLTHELWKVPLPKQSSVTNNRASQGGLPSQNSGWPSGSTNSWGNMPNNVGSGNRYSAAGAENSAWAENKTWVVLTNLNPQTDFASLRNLCSMKGNMLSFQPNYPMRGTRGPMVLVRYSSTDDAVSAKKALNMSMSGSTMLVATIASDQEVSNIVNASAGNSWNVEPNQSRFTSRHSYGSSGTLLSNQQQQQPPPSHFGSGPMMHGSASTGDMQRLWSSGVNAGPGAFGAPPSSASWSTGGNPVPGRGMGGGGGGSSMWGSMAGAYEDPARMMSPLHSLLPENLLGGEMM